MVAMVKDYFSDKSIPINACVSHDLGDGQGEVAYGRPIEIGNGTITLPSFEVDEALKMRITTSRTAIVNDQKKYEACLQAEENIKSTLGNNLDRITYEKGEGIEEKGVKKPTKIFTFAVNDSPDLEGIKASIAIIAGVSVDNVTVEHKKLKVSGVVPGYDDALKALAEVLDKPAQEHILEQNPDKSEPRHQGWARNQGLKPKLPELPEEGTHVGFAKKQGLKSQLDRNNRPVAEQPVFGR